MRAYLEGGGTPEYALDAVLAKCVEDHEALGDGSFAEDATAAAALGALPACANDGAPLARWRRRRSLISCSLLLCKQQARRAPR